jgi:hypothetical protein
VVTSRFVGVPFVVSISLVNIPSHQLEMVSFLCKYTSPFSVFHFSPLLINPSISVATEELSVLPRLKVCILFLLLFQFLFSFFFFFDVLSNHSLFAPAPEKLMSVKVIPVLPSLQVLLKHSTPNYALRDGERYLFSSSSFFSLFSSSNPFITLLPSQSNSIHSR